MKNTQNIHLHHKTSEQRESPYELVDDDVIVERPARQIQRFEIQHDVPADQETKYRIIAAIGSSSDISPDRAPSYGYSYLAEKLESPGQLGGELVFIKTPRISNTVPYDERRRVLAEIFASFNDEYQNRGRIKELNDGASKVAAEIKGFGFYSVIEKDKDDRELVIPFLVQEYIDEKNMTRFFRQYENGLFTRSDGSFSGITSPALWFNLAGKIVDIVRRVHNRHIIHGEIVPKNILLRLSKDGGIDPILVDFGKSFQLDVSSVTGSRVRKDNPYVAPEARDHTLAWYTPADIYSLGGVLLYLATGSPPPDIRKRTDIFETERSWALGLREHTDKWKAAIHEIFATNRHLIQTNEGIIKVIDKCMRPTPAERYAVVEKVQQALHAVNYGERKTVDVGGEVEKLNVVWKQMRDNNDKKGKPWDDVFANVLGDKLALAAKEMVDMDRGHFEIYGEREDLIDTLVKYIGVLKPGDVYVTVTVPEYWTEENLGINGRFLTVNKDLARNGVHVNRLFLVAPEDLAPESPSRKILKAHLHAWESLDDANRSATPSFPSHPRLRSGSHDDHNEHKRGVMYVGALRFSDREEVRKYQRQANHVAIWSRAETGKKMSIFFISRPLFGERDGVLTQTGSQIVKVRFRELDANYDYEQLTQMFQLSELLPLSALASELFEDKTLGTKDRSRSR